MTEFVTTFHTKPWRSYQVHPGFTDVEEALAAKTGIRVRSVTQVIGATTDKSGALKGWAQRETVNALDTLYGQYGADDGIFRDPERLEAAILAAGRELNARAFCELFESQQTTLPWGRPRDLLWLVKRSEESMDAKMKAAADRGLAIHDGLERYAQTGDVTALNPAEYALEHRGYVQGVTRWLAQFNPTFHGSEIVVGSLRHRFGGRLDHHLTLNHPEYGRGLIDLKTNAQGKVYPVEHFTQVEAYELAAVESGHKPTDFRAVLAVGPDGSVDFRRVPREMQAQAGADFVAALEWFNRQKRIESDAKKEERA